MSEPILLNCIFGCTDCKDRLSHYLICNILWSILDEAFSGEIAPTSYSRVNYLTPSLKKIIIISAAFEIYHALKIGLRHEVDIAQSSRKFGEMYRIASRLASDKRAAHIKTFPIYILDGRASHPDNPSSSSYTHTYTHRMNTTIGTQHYNVEGPMQSNVDDNSDSESESIASSEWDIMFHCSDSFMMQSTSNGERALLPGTSTSIPHTHMHTNRSGNPECIGHEPGGEGACWTLS